MLTALFFLYPQVTKTAFDGFPCYTFENGQGFLRQDVNPYVGAQEQLAVPASTWIFY